MKTSTTIGILLLIIIVAGIYYATNRTPNTTTNINVTGTTTETPTAGTTTGTATGTSTTTPASGIVSVDIRNFAYDPTPLTIKKGTKVTWENYDTAPHTVTSVSGSELNSPTMTTGQTFTHTFNTVGTFNYYCTIHPNMKAAVIVIE